MKHNEPPGPFFILHQIYLQIGEVDLCMYQYQVIKKYFIQPFFYINDFFLKKLLRL